MVAGIVFVCCFGGAIAGILLRKRLPEGHLSPESKDAIKLGMGLIATTTALVLGLVVASTKAELDSQRTSFQKLTTNVVLLDKGLALFGTESKPIRELMRRWIQGILDSLWPQDASGSADISGAEIQATGGKISLLIAELKPRNNAQRVVQNQCIGILAELGRTRWAMSQQDGSSIPKPFLVVLIFWLAVLFTNFGLFSPANGTVLLVHLVAALSMTAAIFLIVEMDHPFNGIIQISATPLRNALEQIGK